MNTTHTDQLVSCFAAQLGWRGLERSELTLTPEICGIYPAGILVSYWSTPNPRFLLQFNQQTAGEFGVYHVAVVAEQARIRCTHFEPCKFTTPEEASAEARRLASHCARANFRNRKWVRRYLENHPERLYPQRKRWRGWKARLQTRANHSATPQ